MSSIIFHTDESQALIATDTLAVSLGGKPLMFTTKAFILPHLQLLVAGTGAGSFLDRWFVRINGMVIRDVDNLNYHTPRNLSTIWSRYKEEVSYSGSPTTTVYHFGFSQLTGKIHSYAYRSETGFQAEALPYGMAVKPECSVPDAYNLPDDIEAMMNEQRSRQMLKRAEERVYIGGEIQIHHLTRGGYSVYPLSRFGDYEHDQKAMFEAFTDRAQSSSDCTDDKDSAGCPGLTSRRPDSTE